MFGALQKVLAPRQKKECGDCNAAAARRASYTLLDAAKDTLKGDFAAPDIRAARLEVCQRCEYLSAAMGRCKLCGCFVHLKAGYAAASCDINRW